MGGIAKGIGKVVGSITGANQAAQAQTDAANQSNATALQIYNQQAATLQPFVQSGQSYLTGLNSVLNNRSGTLNDYYNSPEYAGLANQARYQQLASAEATGGLGSTATSNGLASIAPQLGETYLNDRYNQLLGGVNVGLSAAGASNAAAGTYSGNVQNNLSQIGAAKAGNSIANGQTITQGIGMLAGLF
ncbi:DNA transfer protein [Tatumella punctata]|uniref:DNA transfer protein n=1 Tax=Tatumella punctata TaxID=399969 RepID=A0ABW1VIE7_9GAMM